MPRPKCCRRVGLAPDCTLYKPAGVPATHLETVVLTLDELEAVRLADFEGLYHEEAGSRMQVSRPTFSRILETARRKIAGALVEGKAVRIEGGPVEMSATRAFQCVSCLYVWSVPFCVPRPVECPLCRSTAIRRIDMERGCGRGERRRARHRHYGQDPCAVNETKKETIE